MSFNIVLQPWVWYLKGCTDPPEDLMEAQTLCPKHTPAVAGWKLRLGVASSLGVSTELEVHFS